MEDYRDGSKMLQLREFTVYAPRNKLMIKHFTDVYVTACGSRDVT